MSPAEKRNRKPDADRPPEPQVRAAGGLVWRPTFVADEEGETHPSIEIVVVHRPRYDDWSFPKGKLDTGETYEEAAVREVAEETGLRCDLGRELPSTSYVDAKGRPKLVRYWAMRVVGVEPWAPNAEIDQRRWVTIEEAGSMLTYDHDRELLGGLRRELS
jgi:8-oxo-dGTP diphosphatase